MARAGRGFAVKGLGAAMMDVEISLATPSLEEGLKWA